MESLFSPNRDWCHNGIVRDVIRNRQLLLSFTKTEMLPRATETHNIDLHTLSGKGRKETKMTHVSQDTHVHARAHTESPLQGLLLMLCQLWRSDWVVGGEADEVMGEICRTDEYGHG